MPGRGRRRSCRPQAGGGAGGAGALDLDQGTVRVVNAVSEVNGPIVVGPPKSAAGRRTVAVPESVVSVLRSHIASFSEAGPRGRVFVGAKGATLRRTNVQAMWRRAIRRRAYPRGSGFMISAIRGTRGRRGPAPTCAS
jgi:hypothetical protein